MKERVEFLAEVRDRLEQAQQHYKVVYDRRHRPVQFSPGQWVWLRLLHRQVVSLNVQGRGKLGPRFFGPFQISERIGEVAYRLILPAGVRLHDVFHVGLLKPSYGEPPTQPPVLPMIQHGHVVVEREAVLQGHIARGQRELLVRWQGVPAAESSWVPLVDFREQFPDFQLEDKLLLQGGHVWPHVWPAQEQSLAGAGVG
jgi:hypothetical protein